MDKITTEQEHTRTRLKSEIEEAQKWLSKILESAGEPDVIPWVRVEFFTSSVGRIAYLAGFLNGEIMTQHKMESDAAERLQSEHLKEP